MTASQPIAQPLPGSEGLAPDDTGAADEVPPEKRRRKAILLLLLLVGLIALLGLTIWYLLFRQPIPVPTIPGETIMPRYVTSIYGAARPEGVAVTASGDRVYVGETAGDYTARAFDAQGTEVAQLVPPVSTGDSHVPTYVAVNPTTGEVYVSDRPTGSIYVYGADGAYLRSVERPTDAEGWQPLALSFDSAGNLFVTDVGQVPHRVRELDPTGKQIRVFGQDAGMDFPNGIAIDPAGFAYVTDSNNGRLLVFDQAGAIVARVGRGTAAGSLGLPRGVAVDGTGRVYVVDTSGQSVSVLRQYVEGSQQLEFLGSFGTQGVSDGSFVYPNGIAVDGRGRLYVTDSANNRVQLWSY